ncbi:MAG: signal peptidase II [Endomicrobiia bacterium]
MSNWQKILITILVAIDQLTKFLIRKNFELHESRPVTSFFSLTYIHNTGIAFGLFQNERFSNIFFVCTSIIVIILFYLWRNQIYLYGGFVARVGLTLVWSGAFGNLIDRIFIGKVIDFLDFHFWPVFNIADSCITTGGILMFLSFLKGKKKES